MYKIAKNWAEHPSDTINSSLNGSKQPKGIGENITRNPWLVGFVILLVFLSNLKLNIHNQKERISTMKHDNITTETIINTSVSQEVNITSLLHSQYKPGFYSGFSFL